MRLSPDSMLGAIARRPLPRTVTALIVAGAVSAGTYELMQQTETSPGQYNIGVQACAAALGEHPGHVRSADLPSACEPFQATFKYHDVTMRVVDQSSGNRTASEGVYNVPSARDFQMAHMETAVDAANQQAGNELMAVLTGGLSVMFSLASLRRLRRNNS